MNFEGAHEVLIYQKYFLSLLNEMTDLLTNFEISTEMHFISLFFLNE